MRAAGKGTRGFALSGGLQTFGNRRGVERIEDQPVAHHFDFFNHDGGAREVGHSQFINQMGPAVRAGEWDWSILHWEQERRHGLWGLGRTWDRRSEKQEHGQRGRSDSSYFHIS